MRKHFYGRSDDIPASDKTEHLKGVGNYMKFCKTIMQTIQKRSERNMNNKLEVIGIDHGWSMMKTISQVFVTGVKEITTTPALFGDVLEYEGKVL